MTNSAQALHLLQTIEHFQSTTKGAELPKGTEEALEGLSKVLKVSAPQAQTPGHRAALAVAQGSTEAKPPPVAQQQPTPGQMAAQNASGAIDGAATALAEKISA